MPKNCCNACKKNSKRKYRKRRQRGGNLISKVKNMKGSITSSIKNKLRRNAMKPKDSKSKGFDLHAKTLPLLKKVFGKRGAVPKPYHYLGPGNPLEKQVVLREGKIKKILQQPYNALDRVAMKHDVCYANNKKTKNRCDYEMLNNMKSLKQQGKIPTKMGALAAAIIGGKLAIGV